MHLDKEVLKSSSAAAEKGESSVGTAVFLPLILGCVVEHVIC